MPQNLKILWKEKKKKKENVQNSEKIPAFPTLFSDLFI